MVAIFVRLNVRPEKRKELSQTLVSIVEQVKKESGCVNAGFYRNSEDEENILVLKSGRRKKNGMTTCGPTSSPF